MARPSLADITTPHRLITLLLLSPCGRRDLICIQNLNVSFLLFAQLRRLKGKQVALVQEPRWKVEVHPSSHQSGYAPPPPSPPNKAFSLHSIQ